MKRKRCLEMSWSFVRRIIMERFFGNWVFICSGIERAEIVENTCTSFENIVFLLRAVFCCEQVKFHYEKYTR